jgi:diguanylate cyclase (GGDEF)-like protein
MLKKYIYLIVNLFLLIPAIVFVYTYAYNYIDKEVKLLERKSNALVEMQSIYSIITNLQKIRGLSNIKEKNSEIFNKIETLTTNNHYLAKILHRPRVNAVLQRHPKGSITNFDGYTADIEALLLIYKLTAYKAHLTLNSDIKEYLLSKTVTSTLPYLTEYFARIRGLASSVQDHKLDKTIKIKIKNQLYIVEELLKNTKEMKYFNNSKFVDELLASQEKEIKFIRNELLNKEIITASGLDIFNRITKNIDYLTQLYTQNIQELSSFYQERIEDKNFTKLLIILVCILSIVVVISINLFYYAKIQKYIQKVEHLNIIDPMTGLYNRRFLENFIEKFISQIERQSEFFSILMIDIDFFKKVNDTYGHDVGDKVIVTVADVLQQNIRKSDLAIRYGGEEFMVLLHYADKKSALMIAQKIKDAFENIEFHANNKESFHKTLSIGIAEFPKDAATIWECIKLADNALYIAKTTGRNKIITYVQEMKENKDLR